MCVCVSSQREFISLWHELQNDRPELLGVLEGILVHAVSQLQDCIRERESLEQALRRFCLPPSCPPRPPDDRGLPYSLICVFLPPLPDGKANTTRWFGPFMKTWKARCGRRERNSRRRYGCSFLSFDFVLDQKGSFSRHFEQCIAKSRKE